MLLSALLCLFNQLFSLQLPFYILSPLTGCHRIFSWLPTISCSAATDLNTDLALSVPLRWEQEIPHPLLPPTMLRGWILPVSSVFRLLRVLLVISSRFLHIFFAFQLIWLENTALGSKTCWTSAHTVDPSCQYRLGLSDELYLQRLSILWLGTSLILGYDWYCDSKEIKIGSRCF